MFNIDFTLAPHWADAFQGLGTAAGALISLVGFLFVVRQLRTTREAIESQTEAHIYSMGLEAYRLLIEHPSLGRYLYEGQPLPPAGDERWRALSAFELFCDYFEFIILQDKTLSQDVRDSWLRYMKKLFQRSPALQEFVAERREQYTSQFLAVFQSATVSGARG